MTPAESGRQVRVLVIPWPEQPTKIPAMPSWLIWLLRIANWVELLTQTPYLPLPVRHLHPRGSARDDDSVSDRAVPYYAEAHEVERHIGRPDDNAVARDANV